VNEQKVLNLMFLVSYECKQRGAVTHALTLRYCTYHLAWYICDPREGGSPHKVTHQDFGAVREMFFRSAVRIEMFALEVHPQTQMQMQTHLKEPAQL
jgi:hypothetical protein